MKTFYQIILTCALILTLIVGLKPIDQAQAVNNLLTQKQNKIVLDIASLEKYPTDKELELIMPGQNSAGTPEPNSAVIAQNPTRTASTPTVSRSQPSTTTVTPRPAAPKTVTSAPKPAASTPTPTTASTQGAAVITTAKKYIGVRYQWGGTTTSGFDCSGYTQFVYAKHGINLPRISRDQYTVGKAVSMSSLQQGDLIFFSLDGDKVIDHVGMYVGGGQFIHASSTRGVTIDNLNSYWTSRTIGAKRVL